MLDDYKAVLFDFDDTLVVTHEIKWAQYKEVGKKFYNIEVTEEDLRKHWGIPFEKLQEAIFGNVDTVENSIRNYHSLGSRFLKPAREGGLELMTNLLTQGKQVGVLTAMESGRVIQDFERLGFPYKKFFTIQGSQETEIHKPDPKVFDPALVQLESFGIKPEESLYIGDDLRDYQAAVGAGLAFLGVTTGLTKPKEFEKNKVDYVSSLEELV